MMQDIISDILAGGSIPLDRKRQVIDQQRAEFRNPGTNVIGMDAWWRMGEMMGGVDLMGGPAPGLLEPAEKPAVPPEQHDHRH
ncbi:MAG: hypothetical protein ACOY71_03440 [Gemmatimonadota bacterium]